MRTTNGPFDRPCRAVRRSHHCRADLVNLLHSSSRQVCARGRAHRSSLLCRRRPRGVSGERRRDRYSHRSPFTRVRAELAGRQIARPLARRIGHRPDRATSTRYYPSATTWSIFSEDVHVDGSQWGNFPQTYSHVGLINAAFRIARKVDKVDFL